MSLPNPPPATPANRLTALEWFKTEYDSHSDRRIAAAWNAELFRNFAPAEPYRAAAATAIRCVQTLDQLVADYRRGSWQAVVGAYESWRVHFDHCSDYQGGVRNYVQDALQQLAFQYEPRLKRALEQGDDQELEQILSSVAALIKDPPALEYFERELVLTRNERNQAVLALKRLATVREIQHYLAHKDGVTFALALYDANLNELRLTESKALTGRDRMALYDARREQTRRALRQAVADNDDDKILYAATAALAAGWAFPGDTRDLVRRAAERKSARTRVEQADSVRDLLIAYDDDVLGNDRKLAEDKRLAIAAAKRVFKPLVALKRAIRHNDIRTLAAYARDDSQAHELDIYLDSTEKAVMARVQTAVQTLEALRAVLAVRPRTRETLNRITDLCSSPEIARTLDWLLTPTEKEQIRKAVFTAAAVQELDRLEDAPDTPAVRLARAKIYRRGKDAGFVFPAALNWTQLRAALEFQDQWNTLLAALQAQDDTAIYQAWNPFRLGEALDLLSAQERQALARAIENAPRERQPVNA